MLLALFQGLIVGLAVAVPFGPAGLLCLERTIADGRSVGLSSGLGMAAADAFFATVAAFGLTILSDYVSKHQSTIQAVGGMILICVGVYMVLRKKKNHCGTKKANARSNFRALATTFVLTLSNPATILVVLALFASFGVGMAESGAIEAGFAVIGVFAGSLIWALAIAAGGSALRPHLNSKAHLIKRLTGGMMALIGVIAVAAFLV